MVSTHKVKCCSFCGKDQDQVKTLLAAPKGVYVCEECIGKFQKKIEKDEC